MYIKPELKEPCGGGEKYGSKGPVIAPGKWALMSFKLDPGAGTATVSVDGRPAVSCRYEPGKIKRLNQLDLITWMGNVVHTVKPGQCINPP